MILVRQPKKLYASSELPAANKKLVNARGRMRRKRNITLLYFLARRKREQENTRRHFLFTNFHCGPSHYNRWQKNKNTISLGIVVVAVVLFLTFSVLVANLKKLLYTVVNPACGWLNRKIKQRASGSATCPPRCSLLIGEKNIYIT